MEEIRAAVCDGLKQLSHGGLEVGGILFGTRSDASIRLLAWRPILCEHALGPSFRLSQLDCAGLAGSLEVPESDPDLERLVPVGWFVSHARSGIFLTASDLEIYDRFFPEPWQVTLVVRPSEAGAVQAGFFAREADGGLQSESSYQEFVIEKDPRKSPGVQRTVFPHLPVATARPAPEPEPSYISPPPQPPIQSRPLALEPSYISPPPQSPIQTRPLALEPSYIWPPPQPPTQTRPLARERWFWVSALFLVLVIIGFLLKDKYWTVPDGSFPLRVYDAGDSVRVEWDSNASVIRSARLAVLDIKDGNETKRLALSDEQLHSGKMTYARRSGDLELRMIVFPQDQPGIEQIVRFVGPESPLPSKSPGKEEASLTSAAPDVIRPSAQHDQFEDQVAQLKEELGKQNSRANRLQEVVKILQNRIAVETFRNPPDRGASSR